MKHLITSTALTLLALASGATLAQSMRPAPSDASAYPVAPAAGLYRAFGEEAGIRSLMDDFVLRLKADPRVGEQFQDTNLTNLAKSLSDQLCQLSGGPCVYRGPDMKTAHADRDTTRAQFNALVEVLQLSMEARGIPFTRQNQMLALLAPMHRDVITVR
ncbi:MAG: group 1 truncated hemoglobin [Hydrogenophaga sp.]|uniref:group I truncated hemoglobin n=1 Tax=Hydrogenophaga sp. TaxID=1904254 RepID=UPI002605A1A6|nr:group 1 truncated hemoglobin [Hydrogenophaga sp.]MDM7943080.1 group 1 truncated hemoglobin [Hydrogenophaga sp.]